MAHRGRRRAGSDRAPQPLSLEAIHSSIRSAVEDFRFHLDDPAEITGAATPTDSTPLHEILNEYLLSPRPRTVDDVCRLASLVVRLASICGEDAGAWKVFMLMALLRRYHGRAPVAKQLQLAKDEDGSSVDRGSEAEANGDGERLVFYVTILALDRLSGSSTLPSPKMAATAAIAMTRISPEIGGTRDANALLEHLTFGALVGLGHASLNDEGPEARGDEGERGSENFGAGRVVPALSAMLKQAESNVGIGMCLDAVLEIVAGLLDEDLARCASSAKVSLNTDGNEKLEDGFMSTVHVTLPHRDRGSSSGRSRQRKLANSVAEALVWARTKACSKDDDRFSSALEGFRKRSGDEAMLRRMQTRARKKRKVLNDAARDKGHMLCSSYMQDRSNVKFKHVRCGKAGDLDRLKALASKQGDSRVLKMIASRQMDPNKANPMESIGVLVRGWIDVRELMDEGSIEELEAKLQMQTVKITVDKLRAAACRGGESDDARRRVLVAAVGPVRGDAVCAVLVAAALRPHSGLVLNGEETDVSTDEAMMEALNSIILVEQERPVPAMLKSAQNVLCENLSGFDDAILVSSSNVEVDEVFLDKLKSDGKTLRVHATEKRVEPMSEPVVDLDEGVQEGLKAGRPVSVAVVLDCTGSMGSEIQGCKDGAMRAIQAFGDLAPVKSASFMGYWDPPGSRGDPDPRSTGYLDPRSKENLDQIQEFVDRKLPCTGGGDEPEDVPAALEKLISDMDGAGLDGEDGSTHFVLWIADAGYRTDENARVRRLLDRLYKRGVVMVMCPVRSYGTCRAMVHAVQAAFVGRFVECGGVSALGSIASIVTGAIRASLFENSNVASVTASVGETVEALSGLCSFQDDHEKMARVGELTEEPDTKEEEVPTENEDGGVGDEDAMEEGTLEVDEKATPKAGNSKAAVAPTFVPSNKFCVTNVDRIYLQISRLPPMCHQAVEGAFGGRTLQDAVASDIAVRMMRDGVPVRNLQEVGYPMDIVDKVRDLMGGHGIMRQQ